MKLDQTRIFIEAADWKPFYYDANGNFVKIPINPRSAW